MKVTGNMVERALASWEAREPATRTEHMRSALDAALADVPERQPPVEYGKDRLGWFQIGADGCRHDWDDPEVRIRELEAQLASRPGMLESLQAWWSEHALALSMTSRSVHKAIGVALCALEQGKPFPTMQVLTSSDDGQKDPEAHDV